MAGSSLLWVLQMVQSHWAILVTRLGFLKMAVLLQGIRLAMSNLYMALKVMQRMHMSPEYNGTCCTEVKKNTLEMHFMCSAQCRLYNRTFVHSVCRLARAVLLL